MVWTVSPSSIQPSKPWLLNPSTLSPHSIHYQMHLISIHYHSIHYQMLLFGSNRLELMEKAKRVILSHH
jgi:hypothetical protein